jgi:hypothetical protein
MPFIKYFFLFVVLSSTIVAENSDSFNSSSIVHTENSFQDVISYATEYRHDPTLSTELEEKRKLGLLERVYGKLLNYNSQDNLENAIKAFLIQVLSKDFSFTLVDSSQTDMGGKSHDPVFMVKDQKGDLCYILKAFQNPRQIPSKFLPEISALDLIKQLSLPNVGVVEPLAFASYGDGKQEWGLLLESVAKGKRIDQYVLQIAKQEINSEQRFLYLQVAQKAFNRMGEGLAELHRIKSPIFASIPAAAVVKYEDKLNKIINDQFIVDQLSKHFSLSDFITYVENIKNEGTLTPVAYSYWHGDAHLGNMFYDELDDSLYFIDVAKMHLSIDIKGQPLLDGTVDLIRVEENFRRISLGLLTEEELDLLLTTFYRAYEYKAGQLPDKRLLTFHKTYVKLGRLIDYSRYIDEPDLTKQSIDKAVFDSATDYFKNILS